MRDCWRNLKSKCAGVDNYSETLTWSPWPYIAMWCRVCLIAPILGYGREQEAIPHLGGCWQWAFCGTWQLNDPHTRLPLHPTTASLPLGVLTFTTWHGTLWLSLYCCGAFFGDRWNAFAHCATDYNLPMRLEADRSLVHQCSDLNIRLVISFCSSCELLINSPSVFPVSACPRSAVGFFIKVEAV